MNYPGGGVGGAGVRRARESRAAEKTVDGLGGNRVFSEKMCRLVFPLSLTRGQAQEAER
jgi:hypothetical protein